jgi:hypothetical protein
MDQTGVTQKILKVNGWQKKVGRPKTEMVGTYTKLSISNESEDMQAKGKQREEAAFHKRGQGS